MERIDENSCQRRILFTPATDFWNDDPEAMDSRKCIGYDPCFDSFFTLSCPELCLDLISGHRLTLD